jgi:hypothetical protein
MNLNKKERRKGKSDRKININLIRELNKNNYFYEIENIIKHKLNENSDYTFLVKWKDYDSNGHVKLEFHCYFQCTYLELAVVNIVEGGINMVDTTGEISFMLITFVGHF